MQSYHSLYCTSSLNDGVVIWAERTYLYMIIYFNLLLNLKFNQKKFVTCTFFCRLRRSVWVRTVEVMARDCL